MGRAVKVIILVLMYVAAVMIIELLGFYHPFAWTYAAVFAAVTAAWPYFKLCQSNPMPGMAIICAVALLLVNFLFGQGHEVFAAGCIGLGCVAECLRRFLGNYRGRNGVIASYAVMSLIPFSKSIVLWIDYDTAMELVISRMGDIYAAVMGRMLSKYMFAAMFILTLIFAVVTMWILTKNWRPREFYHVARREDFE
ncbi:MAG: MptD family putative ECF transporter S component [Muribaculaceae bacterium]|nr:MptD family putative ECF transporter S component [Muribaculaceae bacterium]